MGNEFLDELGETITKTARGLSERAEMLYETQKLRNKISGEERLIGKTMAELGNLLYKRYLKGEALDDELKALCEQIEIHKEKVRRYKDSLANKKGRKICPSCQKAVDREAAFCSYCGAPCAEPEDTAEDTVVEVPEEAFEAEDMPEMPEEDISVGEFETETSQADDAEGAPLAKAVTEEMQEEEKPTGEKE